MNHAARVAAARIMAAVGIVADRPPPQHHAMRPDPHTLVPKHKLDLESARALVALGYPAVAPVASSLLQWVQDINWPVAHILAPFLASIGEELAPQVKIVLESGDEVWKYNLIQAVVAASPALSRALREDLARMACSPTPAELREEVDVVALGALEQLR